MFWVIVLTLPHEHHLPRLHKPLRLDAIKIHASRHLQAIAIFAIPLHAMITCILLCVHHGAHSTAKNVENLQLNVRRYGKFIFDRRDRIKWIGIILMQRKSFWQYRLIARDCSGIGIERHRGFGRSFQNFDIACIVADDGEEAVRAAEIAGEDQRSVGEAFFEELERLTIGRNIKRILADSRAGGIVRARPVQREGCVVESGWQRGDAAHGNTGVDGVENLRCVDRLVGVENNARFGVNHVAGFSLASRANGVVGKALAAMQRVVHRQKAIEHRQLSRCGIDGAENPKRLVGGDVNAGGDIHEHAERVAHVQALAIESAILRHGEGEIGKAEAAQPEAACIERAVELLRDGHHLRRGRGSGGVVLEADGLRQSLRCGDPTLVAKTGRAGDIVGVESGSNCGTNQIERN